MPSRRRSSRPRSSDMDDSKSSENNPNNTSTMIVEKFQSFVSNGISMMGIYFSKMRIVSSNIYLSYQTNNVDIRSFSSIVDWLSKSVEYCDLGGEEIYYMFVGGIIFIVLSHLFSFLMENIIYKFLISFQILNQIIVFLAQLTLFVVFLWFILAFFAFLYVLFGKENAWIQTQRERIKHGLNPLNGDPISGNNNDTNNSNSNTNNNSNDNCNNDNVFQSRKKIN